jgi:hypothetical protein
MGTSCKHNARMKNVPILTLRESLSYDPASGEFVWLERPIHHFKNDHKWSAAQCQKRWNTQFAGKPAMSLQPTGYKGTKLDGASILAHRAAFAWMVGRWPEGSIDHANGVRTDNRWANLREATRTEQNRNKAAHSDSTSRFIGVSFRPDRGKWRANIFVDGKQVSLGVFTDEEEAARAYDIAAAKHFGNFARLNFPPQTTSAP